MSGRVPLTVAAVVAAMLVLLGSAGGATAAPAKAPIVTSADAGGLPQVSGFAADGSEQFSFLAFDADFTGGVRVAVGDVNGDGVPDLVTSAGPGTQPTVNVFDGATHALIRSFLAYDPGFTGGVYVAAGDVNGDGRADIVTGADAGGGPHVKVFSGADGGTLESFFAFDPSFAGGVRVAAGDVDGDGLADVIAAAGPGGGPHVRVFDGATQKVIRDFLAYDPGFTGGVYVAAGDLDGDRHADIVTGAGAGGAPHVKVFSGADGTTLRSFFAFDVSFSGGVRVAAGDVNGEGTPDLIVGAGPGGAPHVKVFDGKTGAVIDSFFAYSAGFSGGVYVASPVPSARELLVNVLVADAAGVGTGTSLTDKVQAVEADLAVGAVSDACGTLRALVNQVRAQTGKSLTAAQAATLTADAMKLQTAVPC